MKSKLLILILIINFMFSNAVAIEPDVFVQSTVNRASKLLSENISKEKKIEKLKLIAKDTVDIRGIGFYTLGAARKNLSEENKSKYIELFEGYFLIKYNRNVTDIDMVIKLGDMEFDFSNDRWHLP